jgi:hypothetical protein
MPAPSRLFRFSGGGFNVTEARSKQQEARSKWKIAKPICHSGHRSGISYKINPETDSETDPELNSG